ncbi:DNA repair protein RecO [Saccharospirillum impatiens]|uniref:DNA repair protein RecO n=1 Tax=Saccharospirillum impatiens TaxID=169438 RepID=UPI0003F87D1C|nr:DNA repair protein RecO C-terminal domain-containing protein [Saccharospirillum impatiens]
MTGRRAPNQPAFVLHARPFREAHWLLELLTPDLGRFTAVGRTQRPALFCPCLVRTHGHSELKQLNDWRYQGAAPLQRGAALVQGLYINELCVRLVPRFQADEGLFGVYASTLLLLARPAQQAPALRYFERKLLEATGFGLDYRQTMDTGEWIEPNGFYRFDPARGFCLGSRADELPGSLIQAIADNNWQPARALATARLINASRIQQVLDGRSWHSKNWVC